MLEPFVTAWEALQTGLPICAAEPAYLQVSMFLVVVATMVAMWIGGLLRDRLAADLLAAFYEAHPELAGAWEERDRLGREEPRWPFTAVESLLARIRRGDEARRRGAWWELSLPTVRAWMAADPGRECRQRVVLWAMLLGGCVPVTLFLLLASFHLGVKWWCAG